MPCQPFDDMEILFYSKGRCWHPGSVETEAGGPFLDTWASSVYNGIVGRTRWGVWAALYPKRSICGIEFPFQGSAQLVCLLVKGVEDRVLRGRCLRTPSDGEPSSGKETSLGDAGEPGLSRKLVTTQQARVEGGCTTVFFCQVGGRLRWLHSPSIVSGARRHSRN
jgi:hypothetical protein